MIIVSFQDASHISEVEKVMGKYNEANVAILNTPSFLGVEYAPPTPAPAHTMLKQSQGDKEIKRKASDDKGPKRKKILVGKVSDRLVRISSGPGGGIIVPLATLQSLQAGRAGREIRW